MTNTETMSPTMTDEQKRAYRADEAGFMSDLGEVTSRYGVLRVGRFIPGDHTSYAGAYVLRRVGYEYVTCLIVRRDDVPGPVVWSFQAGHYTFDFDVAIRDLNIR